MPARPIFILGRHRSGTTWLANILASLPEVYTLSQERHRGVHESAYFSHLVPYCGHGRTESDLRAVKRLFEGSDFFAMTRLDRGPEIVGPGPAGYFRALMDAGAEMCGASHWLEKTPANTLIAGRLRDAFPDAVFLAIVRDYRDVVASLVHGFGDPDSVTGWFRQSFVTAIYEKMIARSGATVVRYESLLRDYDGNVRTIMTKLGIAPACIPQSGFRSNSLYASNAPAIRWWQSLAMAAGRWLVGPCPGWLVERAVMRRLDSRPGMLPSWFFASNDSAGGSVKAQR